MPFNRIDRKTAVFLWVRFLTNEKTNNEDNTEIDLDESKKEFTVPTYYPGLNLIPIPDAGIWGKYDVAFLANIFYVIGSIIYTICSFYMIADLDLEPSDDALQPGVYLNFTASFLFLINAYFCLLDGHLQDKQKSIMNIELSSDESELLLNSIPKQMSYYYYLNNMFFLAAAILYLIQATWYESSEFDIFNCVNTTCDNLWMNFFSSGCYVVSACFAVLEGIGYSKLRQQDGLPPLKLFSYDIYQVDWFAWGDYLYVFSALEPFWQTFYQFYINDSNLINGIQYSIGNIFFLLDSIAYMIGYFIYIAELRKTMKLGHLNSTQVRMIYNVLATEDITILTPEEIRQSVDIRSSEPCISFELMAIKINEAKSIRSSSISSRQSKNGNSTTIDLNQLRQSKSDNKENNNFVISPMITINEDDSFKSDNSHMSTIDEETSFKCGSFEINKNDFE